MRTSEKRREMARRGETRREEARRGEKRREQRTRGDNTEIFNDRKYVNRFLPGFKHTLSDIGAIFYPVNVLGCVIMCGFCPLSSWYHVEEGGEYV